MATRLEAFQRAYVNLDLLPLRSPKELAAFRVEYGANVLAELEQLIEDDDSRDRKTIFAGHRGCGKSTLLAEFGRKCEQGNFFVVFFSIANTIEMSDVNHINILFAIAVNLMAKAEQESVEIPASLRQAFIDWFAEKTQTIETKLGTGAEVGFNLFSIIQNKLKAEATVRNELKREFERKVSELVGQINAIAAAIENATDKQILVIIDDLDKLDLATVREVYREHIKALFLPGFRIIYTTPVASLRDAALRAMLITETDDQIVEMPVAKLFGKVATRTDQPVPIADNRLKLCQVLNKRIAPELMEPEIAEAIVLKSGGVLRELIRLANKCCRICLRTIRRAENAEAITIDRAIFDQAVQDMRLDFEAPLGKADYEILQKTYSSFEPEDPKEQAFLDLLHGLHILEYRNGQIWYDLHPVVTDLLKLKEMIDG
ncbi:MAG: P-loop NTPase fold protein [Phormidesmis sp.]